MCLSSLWLRSDSCNVCSSLTVISRKYQNLVLLCCWLFHVVNRWLYCALFPCVIKYFSFQMRLLLHGRLSMNINEWQLNWRATRNPYDKSEQLEIEWKNVRFEWTNGTFHAFSRMVLVRVVLLHDSIFFYLQHALKYLVILICLQERPQSTMTAGSFIFPLLNFGMFIYVFFVCTERFWKSKHPKLKAVVWCLFFWRFSADLVWHCRDEADANNHYNIRPCAPDKLPELPPGKVKTLKQRCSPVMMTSERDSTKQFWHQTHQTVRYSRRAAKLFVL